MITSKNSMGTKTSTPMTWVVVEDFPVTGLRRAQVGGAGRPVSAPASMASPSRAH